MKDVDNGFAPSDEKTDVRERRDIKAYSSDDQTMRSIRLWRKSSVRPDLFVVAPIREVGERELIEELAEASYEVQGFRDARRRHFVSRAFPFAGSEAAYARFADRAFDVSEVTDGFYGVDNIDLTEWVGRSLSYERSRWQRLLTHVSDHPETDFVFLAYTRKEEEVHKLVESISSNCGIAIAIVRLDYPTVEGMARAFVAYSPDLFGPHEGYVAERISSMREMGWRLGYASVRSSALSAIYETSMGSEVRSAINAVFDRAAELEGSLRKPFKIGFSGGGR